MLSKHLKAFVLLCVNLEGSDDFYGASLMTFFFDRRLQPPHRRASPVPSTPSLLTSHLSRRLQPPDTDEKAFLKQGILGSPYIQFE